MDRLVTIKPKAKAEPPPEPKKKTTTKKDKKHAKAPVPYESPSTQYAQFVAPPKERNVPEPAPVVDATYGAQELESEEEQVDEWDALMREAEDQHAEVSVESFAEVATPAEMGESADDAESPWAPQEDDGSFFSDGHAPEWVSPSSLRGKHRKDRKEKKKKTFVDEPLEYDGLHRETI